MFAIIREGEGNLNEYTNTCKHTYIQAYKYNSEY